MNEDTWTNVDRYYDASLVRPDDALEAASRRSEEGDLPAIAVSPSQGKLLHLVARGIGATRILEVGSLGGYSTIWLARALPPTGALVTLELDAHHADVARANLEAAGVGGLVEIRVGRAIDSLEALSASGPAPFDLVFIDADKTSNADYFKWSLRLTHPGSIIVVDNVVRAGAVADGASSDENVLGVRRLVDVMAAEPRIDATAIQTVGAKGYDGFVFGLVVGD